MRVQSVTIITTTKNHLNCQNIEHFNRNSIFFFFSFVLSSVVFRFERRIFVNEENEKLITYWFCRLIRVEIHENVFIRLINGRCWRRSNFWVSEDFFLTTYFVFGCEFYSSEITNVIILDNCMPMSIFFNFALKCLCTAKMWFVKNFLFCAYKMKTRWLKKLSWSRFREQIRSHTIVRVVDNGLLV